MGPLEHLPTLLRVHAETCAKLEAERDAAVLQAEALRVGINEMDAHRYQFQGSAALILGIHVDLSRPLHAFDIILAELRRRAERHGA
jgi:hypothetical protein